MYNKYITVNEDFKSSVNLQFDLYNETKIKQYIPTTDLCDVIKKYLKSVISGSGIKSTFLSGPYGKGKSYLMLILTYLLSKRENRDLFALTVEKFSKIDYELSEMLIEIDERKISFLPIIVSNTFDDFSQNFMLSLKNAFKDHSIENIVPTTTFGECLALIEKWERESTENFDIFSECVQKLNINLDELKNGLRNYEPYYYDLFRNLFKCISHGYVFNPLVSDDVATVYSDVSVKLKDYGYNGMFIIFDEFGAFLDNQDKNFAKKLVSLQNLAEKCNSSPKECQMHLCCVTHKDSTLYQKNGKYVDEFTKIEGRFKQIRFNRSLEENYQILCSAISRTENFNPFGRDKDFDILINQFSDSNVYEDKELVKKLLIEAYPFNPISLYSLIQVSEKIAQNERTLFTFIADDSLYGFKHFISNNSEGLLNVDIIYDYFEKNIKNNPEYKRLYTKVESAKKCSLLDIDHKIFKVIAIINLINDDIKFPCTEKNISLCLNRDVSKELKQLIKNRILNVSDVNFKVDFALIPEKEINKIIDDIICSKFKADEVSKTLQKIDDRKYYFSNKYNLNYRIKRYYRSIYLEVSKFMELSDLKCVFDGEFADGILINLINDKKVSKSDIQDKLDKSNISNLIVRYNNNNFADGILDKIKITFAAEKYIESGNISIDLRATFDEMIEEYYAEIRKFLTDYYNKATLITSYCSMISNLNELISITFERTYPNTIVFNNEMINKHYPTKVISHARDLVVDKWFKLHDESFSPTSAENTIEQCFYDSLSKDCDVISEVKNIILNSDSEVVGFDKIVNKLLSSPYGMRKGILPLFIAEAFKQLNFSSDSMVSEIIILNNNHQVNLSSVELNKAIDNPGNFNIRYAKINQVKMSYVKCLMDFFDVSEDGTFSDCIKKTILSIKQKMLNYAPIIVKSTLSDNLLNLSEDAINFKNIFMKTDINAYDVMFNKIPETLKLDFDDVQLKIKSIFIEYKDKLEEFYGMISKEIKSYFAETDDTIKASYDIWKSSNPHISNIIFDEEYKRIYKTFESIGYDDKQSLNLISNSILKCTVDDWNKGRKDQFFKILSLFVKFVENYDVSDMKYDDVKVITDYSLTKIGETLYNNLLDSMDEFGCSVSNLEKIKILEKLISEIKK